MPTVTPYPISTVQPQGLPNVTRNVAGAGDIGNFGGNQAKDMQVAGAYLDKASDTLATIQEREAKIANDTKIEGDLNGFMVSQQKALSDFRMTRGQDTIGASVQLTEQLQKQRQQAIDAANNPYQREMLAKRLDALSLHAQGVINDHVGQQTLVWQEHTATSRVGIINSDDTLDPMQKAEAVKPVALEMARIKFGAPPDSEVAKNFVALEVSKSIKGSVLSYVDRNQKRDALDLYERTKDRIGLKDDHALHATMKGIRNEVDGINLANSIALKIGLPPLLTDDPSAGGGQRDNNIGNITRSPFQYAGGKGAPDGPFETFTTPEHGVAAAYQTIKAKADQNGGAINFLDLIGGNGKVKGWAAKDDGKDPMLKGNAPEAYATQLAQSVGLKPGDNIPLGDADKMATILKRMNTVEKGKQTVPDAAFDGGIKLARGGTPGAPSSPGTAPTAYKGDIKAAFEKMAYEVTQSDAPQETKQAALALINKQGSALTAFQTAGVKSLKDEFNSTLVTHLLTGKVEPTVFAALADKAASYGDQDLSKRYQLIALLAPQLKNGLQGTPDDVLKLMEHLSEGTAKDLLRGQQSGKGDLAARAADLHAKLKQGISDNLPAKGLTDLAKQTAQAYADAGKPEKAQEVADLHAAATTADKVTALPPVEQEKAKAELEKIIGEGHATAQQVELNHLMKQGIAHLDQAFKKDAITAGAARYDDVGPLAPIDWNKPLDPAALAKRNQQALLTSQHRGGIPVNPFTEGEMGQLRNTLDNVPAAQQATIFRGISGLPAESIPHVAAALAGKHDTSDPLSRSYAAALSFYADKDPQQQVVADQILRGAQIIKQRGESGHKEEASSQAWQQALQTKVGNAFVDMGAKVPAVVADAVASVYAYQMQRAGKQGDKLDPDVLNQALEAVVGKTIARNGQTMLPPKGVDAYQIDGAVRSLSDGDFANMTTQNGTPITAEKVIRYGRLTNAGQDGKYYVSMPDPANGGAPGYAMTPDGKPYVLDLKPLLERAQRFPGGGYNSDLQAAKDARRQAPTLADVQP